MRVLHLLNELHPSGMERMLVSGAPYFSDSGIETLVVGQGANHPYSRTLMNAGLQVIAIEPIKSLSGLSRWGRLLRETKPDVVHIHTEQFFAGSVDVAHWASPRARIVRTLHSFFLASGWWGVKRRAQAMASDRYVSAFVTLNEEMARHEEGFGRNCQVVGNWVDDRFFSDAGPEIRDGSIDIVVVGNCAPVKNHEVVLEAALRLGANVAHVGQLAGASADERRLLEGLARSGLLAHSGPADPYQWLRAGRVFAMPSLREGFPVALAEAIAMGRRCVVSDIAGHQWAGRYPLVKYVNGHGVEVWAESLQSALATAGADASVGAARLQQQEAKRLLSAKTGVERYVEIYRSGPAVGNHG